MIWHVTVKEVDAPNTTAHRFVKETEAEAIQTAARATLAGFVVAVAEVQEFKVAVDA